MVKIEGLRDGTSVVLEEPKLEDVDMTMAFFKSLPIEDRWYLRVDADNRNQVESRVRQGLNGELYRVHALFDGELVAIGALEYQGGPSRNHVGEIRVIVAQEWRMRGVGTVLIRHLFEVGKKSQMEKIFVRIAETQTGARRRCEHLGFRVDAVLDERTRDEKGQYQPIIVMSITLDEFWKAMTDFYEEGNWPDG